jgi:mRNA interferase MazF
MPYNQYDIVIVNLDPTVGVEIKKTRPCVIVSPDEMNHHLATVVICPITSQSRQYPTRIEFNLEGEINWIMIDQIRTIDKRRILKTIGSLDVETLLLLKNVIQETFVD